MRPISLCLLPALLLGACSAGPTQPEGDADTGAQPSDTDTEEVSLDVDFVMDHVELLASGEGFDLTGDGAPDNALATIFEHPMIGDALGGDPDDYIARSVQRGELLVLLDFDRLGDLQDDASAGIDMLLGASAGGGELFDGSGQFAVRCGSLDESGAAASVFEEVSLSSGALSGAPGEFLFLMPFALDTVVVLREARIEAEMSADGLRMTGGTLGGSVTMEDLEEVVENDPEIGPQFASIMLAILNAQLDVDQDGDGEPDALSASFGFTAVRGAIDREGACDDE